MAVVEIDQKWVDEVHSLGSPEAVEVSTIVEEALRQHLFHLRQKKIERERRFYEENYPQLAAEYLGTFIAIHQCVIVDSDADGRVLARRVRTKFGRSPIAIIQVQDSPNPMSFNVRRPQLLTAQSAH